MKLANIKKISLLILLLIVSRQCLAWDFYKCEKNLLMSTSRGGFNQVDGHYFFGYEETRDTFNIPHDLKILEEVFNVRNGAYIRNNLFWKSHDVLSMVSEIEDKEAASFDEKVDSIKQAYEILSLSYQYKKNDTAIPLS